MGTVLADTVKPASCGKMVRSLTARATGTARNSTRLRSMQPATKLRFSNRPVVCLDHFFLRIRSAHKLLPNQALVAASAPVTIARTKDWAPARHRSRPAHRRGNSTSGTARRPTPGWLRPDCVRCSGRNSASRARLRSRPRYGTVACLFSDGIQHAYWIRSGRLSVQAIQGRPSTRYLFLCASHLIWSRANLSSVCRHRSSELTKSSP
jgi:hypothetical protein